MSSKRDAKARAHIVGSSNEPAHSHSLRLSWFRPGRAVEVFSCSIGRWFPASVVRCCALTCRVHVEFKVDGSPAQKTLHVDSEHLRLLPSGCQTLTVDDHRLANSSDPSSDELEGAVQEYDPAGCFPWPALRRSPKCLKAGEQILGAAVVSTAAETGYKDIDNPGQFWERTGKQVVPVANHKSVFAHSAGAAKIHMTKDVDVDEDFGGRDSMLRITSNEKRELLRTSSCGLKGDVEKLKATLEASLSREVGEGKGSLAFEFTIPCLHLKLKQKGRCRNDPHIAEVIIGCQATGEIKASGARKGSTKAGLASSLNFDAIGANLVSHHGTSIGAGGYDVIINANGGPQLSFAQQTRTMDEIIHHLQTEWHQSAAAKPQTWKVLWVKVGGKRPSVSEEREHLVLIYGEVGVGKSTFVNELVGNKVAKEGLAHRGVTKDVKEYQTTYENVSITFVDVPGIGDKDRTAADVLDELWTLYEASRFSALVILVNGSEPRFTLGAQLIPRLLKIAFKDMASSWGESTLMVGTKFDRIPPEESHEEYLIQMRNIAADISSIAGTEPIPEDQIIAKSKGDAAKSIFERLMPILDKTIPIAKPVEAEVYEAYLDVYGKEEAEKARRQAHLKRLQNYMEDGRLEELKRCLEETEYLFPTGETAPEQLSQIEKARIQAKEWEVDVQQAIGQVQHMIDSRQFSALEEVQRAATSPALSQHEQFQTLLSHASVVHSLSSQLASYEEREKLSRNGN